MIWALLQQAQSEHQWWYELTGPQAAVVCTGIVMGVVVFFLILSMGKWMQ